MKMIFFFIDGFGIGERDAGKNPVYAAKAPCIRHLLEHCNPIPTDATLDVPGLPQSATGQTAIFTGVNASKAIGKHLSGQPTPALKEIIEKNNLFKELISRGFRVTNANIYRYEYLEKMLDPNEKRYRPSVTSVMTLSAGVPFKTVEDYNRGKGVYHDITGQIIKEFGYDVELITPEEAARRVYVASREYDFTLFEHFMSDIVGHMANMEQAVKEIEVLDAFLTELLRRVDLNEDIIVITSDHGNIEDIDLKTHTMNKVPTWVLGNVPAGANIQITSLTDIMPVIVKIFEEAVDGRKD